MTKESKSQVERKDQESIADAEQAKEDILRRIAEKVKTSSDNTGVAASHTVHNVFSKHTSSNH
jgi:hypothetical protein